MLVHPSLHVTFEVLEELPVLFLPLLLLLAVDCAQLLPLPPRLPELLLFLLSHHVLVPQRQVHLQLQLLPLGSLPLFLNLNIVLHSLLSSQFFLLGCFFVQFPSVFALI